MKTYTTFSIILMSLTIMGYAQNNTSRISHGTIDAIVGESLHFISGSSANSGDWEHFRNLFDANARFALLKHGDEETKYISFSLEDFVRHGKTISASGNMKEIEIAKIVNEWNGIAQVFQSYELQISDKTEQGINSYELYFDGERWWITSLVWTSTSNGTPLPENLSKR